MYAGKSRAREKETFCDVVDRRSRDLVSLLRERTDIRAIWELYTSEDCGLLVFNV